MANYLVRVQLSLETVRQYTSLRDALLNVGFTKRIVSKKEIVYRLPNGTYFITTNESGSKVFKTVCGIAYSMDKKPMIVVAEVNYDTMSWDGLQVVTS